MGARPNAININTLEIELCLREAGAGGSNPLTPTKSRYEKVGYLTRQGEATFSLLFFANSPNDRRVRRSGAGCRGYCFRLARAPGQ